MITTWRRCLLSVLLLCISVAARGQIVLTNYSSANPLKIMAVGDSITDDCVVQGAWREPLQPLLETNGFPFTFVGREFSTRSGAFTKTNHEGHCGAVVAAPGLFGDGHQYSSTQNYLQHIVPQAFTNAIPDVMLLLIGANDIGNGRNPWLVATNHVSTLLNIIYSNAPNVTVILAKATRLENYSGSVNGANIPIYNAALQAVVNQRRALGQKAYLADLYSAVAYPTMFSDGLHPNATGMLAAAKEWLARLQTIAVQTNIIVTNFIYDGANWKYNDTGQDLGTNWAQPGYDDSGWSNGPARLGYGDPATATTVSFGPQTNNKYVTTYFRRSFVVPWNAVITNLNLRVAQADGVVVWLNGQEIYRTNLPAGPITFTNLALSTMSYYPRYTFYPTNVPVAALPTGANWIAVEVHAHSVAGATMGFDMELIGTGYPLPPPSLSIALVDSNSVTLNWPLAYGSNFSLCSTTDPSAAGSWALATGTLQTNNGQITVTQSVDSSAKFFRLQQP